MFGLLCFLVKKNPTAQSLTSRLRPLTRRASHPARMAAAAVVCGAAIVGTSSIARVSNRVHRRDERRERQSQSNSLTALCLPRSFATRAQGYRVEQPSPPPRESVRWDHSPLSRWRTANPSTGAAAADVKTRTRTRTRTPSERPLRVRARFGPELTARGAANAPQPASP